MCREEPEVTITSTTSVVGINYQLWTGNNHRWFTQIAGIGSSLTWTGIATTGTIFCQGTNATTGCVSAKLNPL